MFHTPEEIDKEIEHQHSPYRSYQQNLHYIKDQIAMFAGSCTDTFTTSARYN